MKPATVTASPGAARSLALVLGAHTCQGGHIPPRSLFIPSEAVLGLDEETEAQAHQCSQATGGPSAEPWQEATMELGSCSVPALDTHLSESKGMT